MFKLTSDSDEGFSNRSKDIFAGIDDLAKTKKDNCKEDSTGIVDANATEDKQKATLDFKGRESIFRSPNETGWPPPKSNKYRRDRSEGRGHGGRRNHPPPNRRGHRTPDHVANPNKYTKYSLSDVSKDQISDRSNTRAAFDFLRELKDRKEHTSDDSVEKAHEKSSSHKVTFKKPNRSHQEQQQPTTSVVHDGVKRVMPECVVGQKRPKENDKLATTQMKNKKAKKGLTQTMAGRDGDLPPPDFLAFSASSTPKTDRFQPKRGKKNRYDNWQQFGRFENRGQQQQNNYFYSSPNWTQQGFNPHRGWRGSPGGHNRGQHGGRFVPRGGNRSNRGHHQHHHHNSHRSYFHPSMLEDPWADLMMASAHMDNSVSNDSLMPQVGDSFIDPAPDVPDILENNAEDLSAYSFTEPLNEAPKTEEASDRTTTSIDHNDIDKDINVMSDSMIPQVGDSILERNEATSSAISSSSPEIKF